MDMAMPVILDNRAKQWIGLLGPIAPVSDSISHCHLASKRKPLRMREGLGLFYCLADKSPVLPRAGVRAAGYVFIDCLATFALRYKLIWGL